MSLVDALLVELARDPDAVAASLRDPEGPLRRDWPAVHGDLDGAPIWVLHVTLDPEVGSARWDGVLAWTAPHPVDHVVLRVPAADVGGRVDDLRVDGVPVTLDHDLLRIPRSLGAGDTVALRLSGTTTVGEPPPNSPPRLFRTPGMAAFTSWLPLPTPCGPSSCDEVPYAGASDPGAFPEMVFVGDIDGVDRTWTVVHPGPDGRRIVAIGVRELPLVALQGWRPNIAGAAPTVRIWWPDGAPSPLDPELPRTVDAAVRQFTRVYGPLSVDRLDVIPIEPAGHGVELPGMVLVPAAPECVIVAHEVAHEWWYGEVGSDALAEPWVDEALAMWSALDACLRGDDQGRWLDRWAEQSQWSVAASATAADLGPDGWGAVYVRGGSYWRELHLADPEALDPALSRWLADHRWGFATASELRAAMGRAFGPEVEERAWTTWMARPTDRDEPAAPSASPSAAAP